MCVRAYVSPAKQGRTCAEQRRGLRGRKGRGDAVDHGCCEQCGGGARRSCRTRAFTRPVPPEGSREVCAVFYINYKIKGPSGVSPTRPKKPLRNDFPSEPGGTKKLLKGIRVAIRISQLSKLACTISVCACTLVYSRFVPSFSSQRPPKRSRAGTERGGQTDGCAARGPRPAPAPCVMRCPAARCASDPAELPAAAESFPLGSLRGVPRESGTAERCGCGERTISCARCANTAGCAHTPRTTLRQPVGGAPTAPSGLLAAPSGSRLLRWGVRSVSFAVVRAGCACKLTRGRVTVREMVSHTAGAADVRTCASPPPSGWEQWEVHGCSPETNKKARVLLHKWLKHHEATSRKVHPRAPVPVLLRLPAGDIQTHWHVLAARLRWPTRGRHPVFSSRLSRRLEVP